MHGILDPLLLNATAMSDFKKSFTEKAHHAIIISYRYLPCCGVNKVRYSIINIHLPLMIFIRMHSQESQFHNKCQIFSIKSIIYVQIPPFVRAFGKQIQTRVQVQLKGKTKSPKSFIISRRNMSNEVQNQTLGCFYHKSSIMFQPENSFVCRKEMEMLTFT